MAAPEKCENLNINETGNLHSSRVMKRMKVMKRVASSVNQYPRWCTSVIMMLFQLFSSFRSYLDSFPFKGNLDSVQNLSCKETVPVLLRQRSISCILPWRNICIKLSFGHISSVTYVLHTRRCHSSMTSVWREETCRSVDRNQ